MLKSAIFPCIPTAFPRRRCDPAGGTRTSASPRRPRAAQRSRDRRQRRPPDIGLHVADQAARQPAGAPRDGEQAGGKGEEDAVQHGPEPLPRPEGSRPREQDGAGADVPAVQRDAQPRRSRSSPPRIPLPTCARHALQMSVGSRLPTTSVLAPHERQALLIQIFRGEKLPQRRPEPTRPPGTPGPIPRERGGRTGRGTRSPGLPKPVVPHGEQVPPYVADQQRRGDQLAVGHLLCAIVEGNEAADSGPGDRLDPGRLFQTEHLQVESGRRSIGPGLPTVELRRGLEIVQASSVLPSRTRTIPRLLYASARSPPSSINPVQSDSAAVGSRPASRNGRGRTAPSPPTGHGRQSRPHLPVRHPPSVRGTPPPQATPPAAPSPLSGGSNRGSAAKKDADQQQDRRSPVTSSPRRRYAVESGSRRPRRRRSPHQARPGRRNWRERPRRRRSPAVRNP